MKRIVLLRSTDGDPDSRFQKYTWFLEKKKIPFWAFCWDRNCKKQDAEQYIYYHKEARYGMRSGNLKKLLGFNFFILRQLIKRRKDISIIHAADFDTVLPAVFMHLLFRKHIIYDIYDWYVDSRGIKNKLVQSVVRFLEFISIKSADYVIICESERQKQILYTPKHLWILPNIPNFPPRVNRPVQNKDITIAYVGILGYERGIENLIKLCQENPLIQLNIAGFGPLADCVKEATSKSNITYYGSVSYEQAITIMESADLIYAVYETSNHNHILAAPNKYYEGLYLGRPIITTKGTLVGKKTTQFNTGYVIGESYDDLSECIHQVSLDDMEVKSSNARKIWNEKYVSYVDDFLTNHYGVYIKHWQDK